MDQAPAYVYVLIAAMMVVPLIMALVMFWLLYTFINRSRPKNVEKLDSTTTFASDAHSYRCPKCGKPMQSGFATGARGIFWCDADRKNANFFAPLGALLPNTTSLGFKRLMNRGWKCESCHLILIDNNSMISK